MDAAIIPIGLCAVIACALVALVDGIFRRNRVQRELERSWDEIPRDAETGLYDRRVCLQRIAAEVKRARRGNGSVWVGVVTVLDGDADRFGRLLYDSLRLPEVAFRIGDRVVAIARPELDEQRRAELMGRIDAAAPRERLAIGEASWSGNADGTAADLLRRASEASAEVVPA